MANIVIVGSGVAGLSAGIYAQLNGHSATIYERHSRVGGNLTGWNRAGYHIDNCIHWLTGTNLNTSLYKMWQELGVLGDVKIYQGESLYTFEKDGKRLSLYNNLNKIKKEMLDISPDDEKEILSFIKAIEQVQGLMGIAGDKHDEKSGFFKKVQSIPSLFKYYRLTTGELANLFSSQVLKGFIESIISEYFSSLALIVIFATFCGDNGGIPAGSSVAMAERMKERFLSLGGKVELGNGVSKINVNDKFAESVTLDNGKEIKADYVIVTADPAVVFGNLLDKELMPKDLKKQYDNPKMLRFSSYHCAFSCDFQDVPFKGDFVLEVPEKYRNELKSNYLIVREFSHEKSFSLDGKNILQTMTYCLEDDAISFIELSKDRKKYFEKKIVLSENIKNIIVEKFPELRDKLNCIDVWTPASYKRYTGSKIGSFMGFALTSKMIPRKLSNRVKGVNNVILATQWLRAPGGLPIAAEMGKRSIGTIMKLDKR
jgi:phytoene dehydrogenase-like protein